MARSRVTKLVYFDRTERLIASGPDMHRLMERVTGDIADDARPGAPRSDGAGHARGQHAADTIRGEVLATAAGWEGRVGWPRPAYYLLMHEKGWVHKAAKPFLRPAARRRREIL